MEDKIFLKLFLVLIVSLFFSGITCASDILFHEHVGEQAIMYRVSHDGTDLREIGHGLFLSESSERKSLLDIAITQAGGEQ